MALQSTPSLSHPPTSAQLICLVLWFGLGIAAIAALHLVRDAKQKKRLLPYLVTGAGVSFGLLLTWVSQSKLLPIIVPAIALIAWLNLRSIWFCTGCGRAFYRGPWIGARDTCPHCNGPQSSSTRTDR